MSWYSGGCEDEGWRAVVERVAREYRWELDVLREYDLTGRLPDGEATGGPRGSRGAATG